VVLRCPGRSDESTTVEYLGRDIIVNRLFGLLEVYRVTEIDLPRRTVVAVYQRSSWTGSNFLDRKNPGR
jgi:hypothetical protein